MSRLRRTSIGPDGPGRRLALGVVLAAPAGGAAVPTLALTADTVIVRLAEDVLPVRTSGRLLLFLVDDGERRLAGRDPIEAPFFRSPQPVYSVAATLEPGGAVVFGEAEGAWPVPIAELEGAFRAQAVFRCNPDERSHRAWGNPRSAPTTIELARDRSDSIELVLSHVDARKPRSNPDPTFGDALVWVELRSEILSAVRGRDAFLRAGVALPPGHADGANAERRWPTVYVVPGFGGRDEGARGYAAMFAARGSSALMPEAVHVVLDPEGPLGHHGFADGTSNGPVGMALIEELIPHLEERFRLDRRPPARIVTGHSSGGWSAIWLTLMHPETFGACWASAPDPVDFSAFQMTDLYADANLFVGPEGDETPSYRLVAPGTERVLMTTRQEVGVERAMSPDGLSGEQWGAWMAMYSPALASTGAPAWVADPVTGAIDRYVVETAWTRYDIARRIAGDPERFLPLLPRIRIAVGTRDSFYLERAVRRFAERLVELGAAEGPLPREGGEVRIGDGPGMIWFLEGGTHDSIVPTATMRWSREMRDHLRALER
ncbi:MAG TPA: alpha/beta hydrolase-fold protein [Phycisphaerales bacterium]|nr:alpha/beta hydrolase-fold protein [Phycisphaerales bacterium]HMP36172.1 alpha/beta hydrolase-fold protein [Phycisphaerales bacterium]